MTDIDLFAWWTITITAGSIFHALVSIYIYIDTRKRRKEGKPKINSALSLAMDFVFVWVLLGLLVFYITSIQIGSDTIFAVGNILVEAILIVYLVRNRKRGSE